MYGILYDNVYFVQWLIGETKGIKPHFQSEPLSDYLAITNFQQVMIWNYT